MTASPESKPLALDPSFSVTVDGVGRGIDANNGLLLGLQERARQMPMPDGLLLKNFSPDEFACSCGCGLDVLKDLKFFTQLLRNHFG